MKKSINSITRLLRNASKLNLELTHYELLFLAVLQEHFYNSAFPKDKITIKDIATILCLDWMEIDNILTTLCDKGIIYGVCTKDIEKPCTHRDVCKELFS
jgi:DNA-binding MarR family transcriptional regulator